MSIICRLPVVIFTLSFDSSMIFLSIVIPAYNAEPYLRDCIESIVKQYIEGLEIIIVDDGSTDNTNLIADKYSERYNFISVVHQPNGGLSNARNNGLEKSNGKYVWFVDADDWISNIAIDTLMPLLKLNRYDGIAVMSNKIFDDGEQREHFHFKGKRDCQSFGLEQLNHEMSCCVPFTIYRMEFLRGNNLKFCEGIFHEDTEFSPRAYSKLEKLYLLGDVLYFVRQTQGSITRSVNFKKNFDIIKVANSLDSFYKQEIKSKALSLRIARCINASLLSTHLMPSIQRREFFNILQSNKHLFKHFFRTKSIKYIIEGLIICISLRFYSMIYNRYFSK